MCDLMGWKPHSTKAKWKDASVIDWDEDAERELELKCWKVDHFLVVEIQQLGTMMLLLLWELIMTVQDNVVEQWKQTRLQAQLVHIQELDHTNWVGTEAQDLETGLEESGEMEMERDEG